MTALLEIDPASTASRVSRVRVQAAVSLLFFASGMTGLAYEVIWFKRFAHVWGSSSLAMGCIVASFLLGLSVGAWAIGRLADRLAAPLFWYGVCEAGIGLLALAIPAEIHLLQGLASSLYPTLNERLVAFSAIRFVLSLAILGPPCLLMGGTLPLLARQFARPGPGREGVIGWLYGVNTAGAAAGCFATGFHLLPALGLSGTNTLAAGLNFVIALVAIPLGLSGRFRDTREEEVENDMVSEPPSESEARANDYALSPSAIAFVAAVTGCASLVLQMIWARQLALMLGGSTYSFSAMLFVFLTGIGLGSLIYMLTARRLSEVPSAAAFLALGVVLGAVAGRLMIPALTFGVGLLLPLRDSAALNAALCAGASAMLELPATIFMGMLLPLLIELARRGSGGTGRAVGNVYAWNTAGAIVGALATSPWLIPRWGTGLATTMSLAAYVGVLPILVPPLGRARRFLLLAALLIGVGALALSSRHEDPRVTNSGMFLYGYSPPADLLSGTRLMYFREGATCNVLVTESPSGRALRVNGKVDATTHGDMDMQVGLALVPHLVRPDARDVLVIGFGSGVTSGTSLLFPNTSVTCCEIEPAVVAAAPLFAAVNHLPWLSGRFSVALDDGRNYLQASGRTFDLILSAPSNPWLAGLSNLFTREFYESAKGRLNEGGVLAQWVQLYAFTAADYALVLRTMRQVFPHCLLVRISAADTMILASDRPFALDRAGVEKAQAIIDGSRPLKADLAQYFGTTDVRSLLLTHLLLDDRGLERFISRDPSGALNTDTTLRLEFDAPLRLYRVACQQEHPGRALVVSSDADWFERLFSAWGCGKPQIDAVRKRTTLLVQFDQKPPADRLIDLALRVAPDDPFALAERIILDRDLKDDAFRDLLGRVVARSADEANRAGVGLWGTGRYERALAVFEALALRHPSSSTVQGNLAANYRALGRDRDADAAFRKALELDPMDTVVEKAFAEFQASKKAPRPDGKASEAAKPQ